MTRGSVGLLTQMLFKREPLKKLNMQEQIYSAIVVITLLSTMIFQEASLQQLY